MPNPCSISGFDASGVLTDAEVLEVFASLPATHVDSSVLKSIEYVDDVKEETDPRQRRFTRYQIFGDCSINEETGEAWATIYRQHASGNPDGFWFRHTILHEVGHAVYYRVVSAQDRASWSALHGNAMIVYNEQSRVPDEHFSNLYAAYVLRHEVVRKGFSDLYTFLRDRVFEGRGTRMQRMLVVDNLDRETVATVREGAAGNFVIESEDEPASRAINALIERGNATGLIFAHDHRQRTTKGQMFRMYGRWSHPGDPDFLDALGDALVEFNFVAYTVELVNQ